ncbi:MAG: phosphoribosyltransferase family protein [Arthrobacter sp.]|nr:phosphoribosyltransferase family protein [Arthrobacter sp.]
MSLHPPRGASPTGPVTARTSAAERVSVCALQARPGGFVLPPAGPEQPVTASNYAAFKYGDTSALPEYARALARAIEPLLGEPGAPVFVTSSGYGFAPPAAAALSGPTTELLRHSGREFAEFRTARSSVTAADYATLPPAERSRALGARHLSPQVPAGSLRGATVVALDDVIVTGVHEEALDTALRAAGAARVLHAYLIDASSAAATPEIEARLNGEAGRDPSALRAVARSPRFTPNSRFLKAVLRLGAREGGGVLDHLPADLVRWMQEAATADRLESIPELRSGARELLSRTVTAA